MSSIANIFRRYGDQYITQFKEDIPQPHVAIIKRIKKCRTIDMGINVYQCKDCNKEHYIYRGCGNRNCPNCQQKKGDEWLIKRLKNSLPGHYFMVTFTVPEAIRLFIRSRQKVAYDALFKASSEALRELIADKRFVGADLPGFFGVLHTWGGALNYHPHIHYIVPGGGIDKETQLWKASRQDYLVNINALSALFRGKLMAILKKEGLSKETDKSVWEQEFNVNCQAVGSSPQGAIKYLAPYVYRVAISDSRIISCKNDHVTFKYKDTQLKKYSTMSLPVIEFIRRFLQHVLPTGFMKVRYYGFMSGSCRMKTEEIAALIELAYGFERVRDTDDGEISLRKYIIPCPHCGGDLCLSQVILPHEIKVYSG